MVLLETLFIPNDQLSLNNIIPAYQMYYCYSTLKIEKIH